MTETPQTPQTVGYPTFSADATSPAPAPIIDPAPSTPASTPAPDTQAPAPVDKPAPAPDPTPAPVSPASGAPSLVQVTIAGQAVYGFVVDTRDVDASPDLEATQDAWTEALVATLGGDLVLVDAAGVRPVTTGAQD